MIRWAAQRDGANIHAAIRGHYDAPHVVARALAPYSGESDALAALIYAARRHAPDSPAWAAWVAWAQRPAVATNRGAPLKIEPTRAERVACALLRDPHAAAASRDDGALIWSVAKKLATATRDRTAPRGTITPAEWHVIAAIRHLRLDPAALADGLIVVRR